MTDIDDFMFPLEQNTGSGGQPGGSSTGDAPRKNASADWPDDLFGMADDYDLDDDGLAFERPGTAGLPELTPPAIPAASAVNGIAAEGLEPAAPTPLSARRRRLREKRARQQRDMLWNGLTVIVWLAMACSIMAFVSIYFNPKSLLNPFRSVEPTLVAAVILPTAAPTAVVVVPPTAAPTVEMITLTPTPTATFTPTIEPTETVTPGPSPTATIHSLYPFILRGDIKVIPGETFPDHDTCKLWLAGQAYDLQGAPMTGITVMMGGYLNGKTLTSLSLTGTALQYGPAGYEFTIANEPFKSKQSIWVMLFDQSMVPLSGKVYFDTTDDCQQNLILINFRQIR